MEKYPDVFDTVVRTSPLFSFVIVTLALAITAPVVSLVVPDNVPVNCWPKPGKATNTKMARQAVSIDCERNDFEVILKPPLWKCDEVLSAIFRESGRYLATFSPASI